MRAPDQAESGFTLVELSVALMVMMVAMVALGYTVFGGMRALVAARHRSTFTEIVNGAIEEVRASAYDSVGVLSTDPKLGTLYPAGRYDGRDAVVLTPGATSAVPPAAESVVTTTSAAGVSVPYTLRRFITWTDASDGTAHVFKRLFVSATWTDRTGSPRTIGLTSMLYPGGLGAASSNGPDQKPVAGILTATPPVGVIAGTTSVIFADTGAGDPNGDPLTYTWSFGDGDSIVGGSIASHVYAAPGLYTAQVTVSDGHGGADFATTTVSVGAATGAAAPTASPAADIASGTAPLTVNVSGVDSTDPNGDPLTYSWSWGDGTPADTGVGVRHTFGSGGSFVVSLTVTDPGGLTHTASMTISTTPLNCDIGAASFTNPGTGSARNDIRVVNGVPVDTGFSFTASTNAACGSVTVRLNYADGSMFSVPLGLVSDAAGTRTWSATTSSSNAFSLGTAQIGEAFAPGAPGTYTFSYDVHA